MARTSKQSGVSMIEGLVAAVLLAFCLMALINGLTFALNASKRMDEDSLSYNIARAEIERIRAYGFDNIPDGTTTSYFDINGTRLGSSSNAAYSTASVLSSDKTATSSSGTKPADNALRTVKVTVTRINGNVQVYTVGTHLVRGGV